MSDFGKWWKDPKKHSKRKSHWLPHVKGLAERISGRRAVRYFTLCARPMIDIFMLVKEGLLSVDPVSQAIESVQFCELDPEHFAEIRDIIAREDAGFQDRLERAVLFEDDDFTAAYPDFDSIAVQLEDEAILNDYEKVDRLQLKRTFFRIREAFPFDFINLDFCDHYYPRPPDMLRINRTVERLLEWQNRKSTDTGEIEVDEFVLAVTCRHDDQFPPGAAARLANLIKENCKSDTYRHALESGRGPIDIDTWAQADPEDFFFAGWPKDIARAAREHGWATDILDYVYYLRTGDSGKQYLITCLVTRFSRGDSNGKYMKAAFHALNKANRKFIDEIDPASKEGQELLSGLREIVVIRNQQAKRVQRAELPLP